MGTMAYTLCQYYPNMKITVCEVQSVVDSARHFHPPLEDYPNQGNISYVVGNFFQTDLPKADLYILSRILHDWPIEKVELILSNVIKCLPSGTYLALLAGIYNGNWTEWDAIWTEIISMIPKLNKHAARVGFHFFISDQNCMAWSIIFTLLHPFWNPRILVLKYRFPSLFKYFTDPALSRLVKSYQSWLLFSWNLIGFFNRALKSDWVLCFT